MSFKSWSEKLKSAKSGEAAEKAAGKPAATTIAAPSAQPSFVGPPAPADKPLRKA